MSAAPIMQPAPMPASSVWAVVVTFNPDVHTLQAQARSLIREAVPIIWVDNGSHQPLDALAAELGIQLVKLGGNHGIAAAQNEGVELAMAQGAGYVLLMDHDSVPGDGMVRQLFDVLQAHPDAAAAGPFYSDPRTGQASHPFVWIDGLRLHRLTPPADGAPSSVVDHLISSGCLLRTRAWHDVGPMLAPLFIDFVDVEWCLRARHKGWHLRGVWGARMSHTIGHAVVRRLGRSFRVHSPTRHYFHVRNGLFLYRQPWIAFNWRVVSIWRMILKTGFYCVFSNNRLAYIRSTLKGILDGWQFNPADSSAGVQETVRP